MERVTSHRSNTSSRLRRVAGADIFECSKVDLLLPDVRLEKFQVQIGWYTEDGTSGAYSTLDVPILHKDWSGEYDIKTRFLHPCLMCLYATLIRGPTAATVMLQRASDSHVVVAVPNTENMERILAIDHTEPGAIAGSAVLAIWTLSADGDLRNKGDRTGIDYDALYDQYLEILTTGLRDGSRSITNVFSEWDRVVFPNSQSGHIRQRGSGLKRGGNEKAMEALKAEKQAEAEGDVDGNGGETASQGGTSSND
ncbi:hypothetical protein DFH09DRAFT_1336945 [Mycena vulgaris]|nr:hypothetical protein DFH09DRAFT_1336945 [Mycena vulgaris]